jgi:hypothetical protein
VPEGRLEDSGSGLAPADDGWFVVNVRDAEWWTSETFGSGCGFESEQFHHCPAGTEHVFVGAEDGPCVILMAGARTEDEQLLYPVSELAARYGASAEEETPDPKQAYAPFERPQRGRPSYWARLPWT